MNMVFSCFVGAEIPPSEKPGIPEHFTKYAEAPDAQSAEAAVKGWCKRVGLTVRTVNVWPASDWDRGQYDDPAKRIVA